MLFINSFIYISSFHDIFKTHKIKLYFQDSRFSHIILVCVTMNHLIFKQCTYFFYSIKMHFSRLITIGIPIILTLSYTWGGSADSTPLMFFFHHPETAQAMKLKLSDFKDTCLRHILQVIPGCYILRCYHGNKITKGTRCKI